MSCHSGCHDNHFYVATFSVRYALSAKKFSRRFRKTFAKSDYQLRHVRPSAWSSSAPEINFRRGVAEAFTLLGCYAAYVDSC